MVHSTWRKRAWHFSGILITVCLILEILYNLYAIRTRAISVQPGRTVQLCVKWMCYIGAGCIWWRFFDRLTMLFDDFMNTGILFVQFTLNIWHIHLNVSTQKHNYAKMLQLYKFFRAILYHLQWSLVFRYIDYCKSPLNVIFDWLHVGIW